MCFPVFIHRENKCTIPVNIILHFIPSSVHISFSFFVLSNYFYRLFLCCIPSIFWCSYNILRKRTRLIMMVSIDDPSIIGFLQIVIWLTAKDFSSSIKRMTDYTFKILVVGYTFVGKTCFIHCYCYNTFGYNYRASIGGIPVYFIL